MCTPVTEGDLRCVAHTRPRYDLLVEALLDHPRGMAGAAARKKIRSTFRVDGENALNVIANHASTPTGWKDVERDIEKFSQMGLESELGSFFSAHLSRGRKRGAERKVATATIKKAQRLATAREQGWRQTGSKDHMKPTKDLDPAKACSAVVPEIVDLWFAEDNHGVDPSQVTQGSNNVLIYRAPGCGHKNESRVNLVTSALRAGRTPGCRECKPHRQRAFKQTVQDLSGLVESLGGDPRVFDTLSAATQYALLAEHGLLASANSQVGKDLAMSIVHGSITLAEVVRAGDISKVEGRMRTQGEDDDLGVLTDSDLSRDTREVRSESSLGAILDATGAAEGMSTSLAAQVADEAVESLWGLAQEEGTDAAASKVAEEALGRARTVHAQRAARRFVLEVDQVLSRTYADRPGSTLSMSVSQRRFAYRAATERNLANLSCPGAGKTAACSLATISDLASRGGGNVLVVAPKGVLPQWQGEFAVYGDNVDLVPWSDATAEVLARPHESGRIRVTVVNYEQFGTESAPERAARIAPHLDTLIFDEVHMALVHQDSDVSNRRAVIESLRDKAGAANENLMVLAASATPVVNNLVEGQSVLRLVVGPQMRRMATKATIKNTVAMHLEMKRHSMRHPSPSVATTITRERVVDVTDSVSRIHRRVESLRSGRGAHVSYMEQALGEDKRRELVAEVTSTSEPVIVYTQFVSGVVDPVVEALTNAGRRVVTYTGRDTDEERAAALEAFCSGRADVLVGSKPVATGIDGLQHVCRKMVILAMALTSVDDDQLRGRIARTGQAGEVEFVYILAEASIAGSGQKWSWCRDSRLARIRYKKSLSDAVVTGVIPDGVLAPSASVYGAMEELARATGACPNEQEAA